MEDVDLQRLHWRDVIEEMRQRHELRVAVKGGRRQTPWALRQVQEVEQQSGGLQMNEDLARYGGNDVETAVRWCDESYEVLRDVERA